MPRANTPPARSVLIFGVGSSLAIDVEESCARLGIDVVAAVRNVAGPSFVSDALPLVEAQDIPEGWKMLGVVLPMFTPSERRAAWADANRRGFFQSETIVDPTAIVPRAMTLGAGVYINAGAILGGAVALGDFVVVNRAASIGHHAVIEDFAAVGPGATLAGFVHLCRGAMIGAGAVILPRVEIGADAIVGAGAVVTHSVPEGCLVTGNPARIVRRGPDDGAA